MTYKIVYDDLWNLSGITGQINQQINKDVENLIKEFEKFITNDSLQGNVIDSMKTYIQEVHGSFLQSIRVLIAEYETNLLIYRDGYFRVDKNNYAVLEEEIFDVIKKELQKSNDKFENQDNELVKIGKTIKDLLSFSVNRGSQIKNNFNNRINYVKNLNDKIKDYEKGHEKDLDEFNKHLTALRKLITHYINKSENIPSIYQSSDISKVDGAKEFICTYMSLQSNVKNTQKNIDEVIKREEARIEKLKQEAIEERKKQASQQIFKGLLILVGGLIAIVATSGAATPIVVKLSLTVSTGTAIYGTSEMLEGGHSRRLALKGEISKKAFNPIRDTIFLGNQKAYDLTGNVLVFGNIFTVGLTQVTNLINNGHSILRAIGSVTTDYVAMGATSYLGGQLAKEGVYRISKDVYELTEEQSKSNARMAEIFGSLLTGVAVAKPVHNKVMNKFGINDKVPVDKLLKEKPKHSEKFNNWEQMKQAHKRTVTKFVKENKPKGSPILKNWFEKGGSVQIDTLENGTQIWKYTNAEGVTVSYLPKEINGKMVKVIEFPEKYMYKVDRELATVDIGKFTGNRELDKKLARKILIEMKFENTEKYALHHHYENGKLQLINRKIHDEFSHYGGHHLYK